MPSPTSDRFLWDIQPVPPDQAERDRIVRELDTTMLVEAAAGTGKTMSLVQRMVALLREGKCDIRKLAAVTFTRKAAAELRDRFRLELEQAVGRAPKTARQQLADALDHIDQCFIGTIHSFCARLLRERPVEAAVDLNFQEIEEETDRQLRRRAWEENTATLFATDDPILAELQHLGLEINQLREAFENYCEYMDVQDWPVLPVALPDLRPAIQALQEYAERMQALAPFPDDRGKDELMDKYELIVRMVSHGNLDRPAELMEILEHFGEPNAVQKQWPGGQAQGKQELERWQAFREQTAEPLLQIWRERRYEAVLQLLELAVKEYDRLRQQAGGLNYQDLLLKSAALLRRQPKVREYFRGRFTHLLVDEFQDTDPIQAEVMLLLTADDPTQTDWRRCRPVPGSLFVVGDPKQSIYRFRRADIVTYNQVRQIIQTCGTVVSLSANFRATKPLIDWINQTFDQVFPAEATDYSPARRNLQVGRIGANNGQLAGVQALKIPAEHANNDAALEYEADLVARTIRRALDASTIPALKPGDFLIIARYKKHLTLYAQKLDELEIPNEVAGGSSLQELEELRLLHICLSALSEPDNPVALVAALRSELFGISDTALYAFKRAGGRFSFYASMPSGLALDDCQVLADAFDRLSRYDLWLKRLPLASALEKIMADLGLPARAAARAGGNVQAGSLAKALELLRAAQTQLHSFSDLVEFLGRLLEQGEPEVDYEGAPARAPGESAARIMNLHKAKGLEAAVVFLTDPTGASAHAVKLHIDRSSGSPRGYLAIHGQSQGHHRPLLAQPSGWADLADKEEHFQKAEEDRLRYVAATRAGALLVITQRQKGNVRNPWQFLDDHMGSCPDLDDPGLPAPTGQETRHVSIADLTQANQMSTERWATILRPTYAVEAAKKMAGGESPAHLAVARPIATDALPGEHGTEWGTVIHLLLETAVREPATDLHKLAHDAFAEQDEQLTYLADAAVATVEKVKRSGIWQRALASKHALVEVPFQVLLPADDPRTQPVPTVLRGVIDLLFLEPRGWVIVDYKTDACGLEEVDALVERYRAQVLLYADAWRQIVGQAVQEVGLYFTYTDRYVALPYP